MSAAPASTEAPSAISPPAARPPEWRLRLGLALLLSAAVLTPCFWQSRIQAGDLSSHIYNAWLASLIQEGKAEGLTIASQRTNVLFDWTLSWLLKLTGVEAAQRIAVSASVLVFVWGAFAWICAASRRRPWFLFPCLMMLAYGWVFHMGFFNFYLSLGLCLWALALAWNGSRFRMLGAPLVALACVAHLVPVAWAAAIMTYATVARGISASRRIFLLGGAVAALFVVRLVLSMVFVTRWYWQQATKMTGADQLWIFGPRYGLLAGGLLVVWAFMLGQSIRRRGMAGLLPGIPFQLFVLTAAAVLLLPTAILFPGYKHALWYIPERMSLMAAVLACGLLASVRPAMWHKAGLGLLTISFFAFLYVDTQKLNRTEDKMQAVVSALPPGERVVSALRDPVSRVNGLTHIVDRACVGRCFSYANYEPSTSQFRIRATHANPIVVADYADSFALQNGTYRFKKQDPPLIEIYACGGELCSRWLGHE